ncbi:TauD/TfdA family dioxygenase [Streptomyces sp. NPDC094038]|uniref:TauD/TfdA family dioxygenase n=1 Tax=Streptomyces sp. NPDC094038 TaxID=3366055 RepID=UPI0037FA67A7
MKGTFRERPDHPHVALRQNLLDSRRGYAPPLTPLRGRAGAPRETALTVLDTQLRPHGIGLLDLDRVMSNEEFRAFGAALGTAQPERSADVAGMVDDDVILNVRTCGPVTEDPARQPFAANWLTLHTESSGAPVTAQPRYVVLMCVAATEQGAAGQTVLVAMPDVHDALSPATRDLLRHLRYDGRGGVPALLRPCDGRPVFSLRDFHRTPMDWSLDTRAGDPAEVNRALAEVYAALYGSRCSGLSWVSGRLVVIDNTRYFHGRTRALEPAPGRVRHLKRLRVLSASGR